MKYNLLKCNLNMYHRVKIELDLYAALLSGLAHTDLVILSDKTLITEVLSYAHLLYHLN